MLRCVDWQLFTNVAEDGSAFSGPHIVSCQKIPHLSSGNFSPRGGLLMVINPLTPELNSSAQRYLTRFFTGDFAS
jgi:hypothetical protein